MEGRGGLWEEHVVGVELVSKLLGWSGTRSGKRGPCQSRWTDEEKRKKRDKNDKGANVWKKQLKGKSKRKGKVERRNVWRWKKKIRIGRKCEWMRKHESKKQIKESKKKKKKKREEKIDKILYEIFYFTNMIKWIDNFIN